MRSVLPVDAALVNQLYIRFVDERGRLQSVIAAFAAQIIARQLFQLGVNQRKNIVEDIFISRRELREHFGYVIFHKGLRAIWMCDWLRLLYEIFILPNKNTRIYSLLKFIFKTADTFFRYEFAFCVKAIKKSA
jgi:hypothetical protein